MKALPIARGRIGSASHGQAIIYMEGKLFAVGDPGLSICLGVIRWSALPEIGEEKEQAAREPPEESMLVCVFYC